MDDTARVLARAIRRRRAECGYSQRRLAAEMVAAGCRDWTASTVAGAERQDKPRSLTVEEVGGLCAALGISLVELVQDEAPEVADRLRGESREVEGTGWAAAVYTAQREEILNDLRRRLAESLEISYDDIVRIEADLYGRDVLAERDARLAGTPAGDPRTRAQRLGHFTRSIRDELASYLRELDLGGPDDDPDVPF